MASPPYPFTHEIDGRKYRADWCLMHGGRVCVRSLQGLGSLSAEVGKAKPEDVARRTLEKLVRADQKRRAKEARDREREMARLRKSLEG